MVALTCFLLFQSTLSMRRATKTFAAKRYGIKISIHALHEESDPNTTMDKPST